MVYLSGCIFAGFAGGAVGIGGVLLAPMLLLLNIDVSIAAPAVLASFLITQPIYVAAAVQAGTLQTRPAALIALGALGGSSLGAFLFTQLPGESVACLIALVAAGSGALTGIRTGQLIVRRRRATESPPRSTPTPTSSTPTVCIVKSSIDAPGEASWEVLLPKKGRCELFSGFVQRDLSFLSVGFVASACSVATATGGGFITLPILFWVRPDLPTAELVALGNMVGVPVALSTFLSAFVLDVEVDFGLALCTALAVTLGIPFGVSLSRQASVDSLHLRLAISFVLLSVGLLTFQARCITFEK